MDNYEIVVKAAGVGLEGALRLPPFRKLYRWANRLLGEIPIECFRVESHLDPHYADFELLYESVRAGQDEWWDNVSTFLNDLHTDPLIVAVRVDTVVGFLQYGYLENLNIAEVYCTATIRNRKLAQRVLCSMVHFMFEYMDKYKKPEWLLYETIASDYYNATGDHEKAQEAINRADTFVRAARCLPFGRHEPIRLAVNFMQPRNPDTAKPPVPMWVFLIPSDPEVKSVPLEFQKAVMNDLYDGYLLDEDRESNGESYNEYVERLRAETIAKFDAMIESANLHQTSARA